MVGTFYKSPEPGAEPYAKIGMRVAPGQTLCIIEAMKIMNELESEISGTVREILVEDAQPVEFGQILFRVEP
jgi:acetyl-CoA carboxylase biotin carboxyl carrier protein